MKAEWKLENPPRYEPEPPKEKWVITENVEVVIEHPADGKMGGYATLRVWMNGWHDYSWPGSGTVEDRRAHVLAWLAKELRLALPIFLAQVEDVVPVNEDE